MLRYLRVVATTSSHHYSQDMLTNGRYTYPQGAITGPTYQRKWSMPAPRGVDIGVRSVLLLLRGLLLDPDLGSMLMWTGR